MYKIPVPITFNVHKHHFRFLKQQIKKWKTEEWNVVEKEMLFLGENLFDFYIGSLSEENICQEIVAFCRETNITDFSRFKLWLGSAKYRKIDLSDSSRWIIKQSINPQRYIHIHPAKYSCHSMRIRATTLKTVVALQIQNISIQENMQNNLEQVNRIRKNYLQLSPVKSLSHNKGIFKIWRLFEDSSGPK